MESPCIRPFARSPNYAVAADAASMRLRYAFVLRSAAPLSSKSLGATVVRFLLMLLLAVPNALLAGQLPPQTLTPELQPQDCEVIGTVLSAYAAYAQQRGEFEGFTGLYFFVAGRSQRLEGKAIPVSRYYFSAEENILFDRIRTEAIFSSLVRRAGFSTPLSPCPLPRRFAFA